MLCYILNYVCLKTCFSCTKKAAYNSKTVHLSAWRSHRVFSRRQPRAVVSVDRLGQWNHHTRSGSYHHWGDGW